MRYLIDSNCFIAPNRTFCPTDVGVSFWNKMKFLFDEHVLCSLNKVREELKTGDALDEWVKSNLDKSFFLRFEESQPAVDRLGQIINWAQRSTFYTDRAKAKFMMMDKADIYLVSYASIRPEVFTVVSQETPNPNHPGEIKLPDVCNAFGTRCIFLQNMFREITETF